MSAKVRLTSRGHSGRLRPHEHTSYGWLFALIALVGLLLSAFTVSSVTEASPPPAAASVSLSGTLPEAPPTSGATITYPTSGTTFQNTPITVSGTCPENTLVEIYKNSIFAGSTPCNSNGTFSLDVDLLFGANTLTAIVYDALNQPGPTSTAVSVNYAAQVPVSALLQNINFTSTQLILESSAIFRGVFPGQQFSIPINILGGVGPFAINVNWGDNTNSVLPSSTNTTVYATHAYKQPGTYKIWIQGSDSQSRVAFLSVAAVVNGQAAVGGNSKSLSGHASTLIVMWPLYACAATMVISFWVGEKREKHVLIDALKSPPTLGPQPHPSH